MKRSGVLFLTVGDVEAIHGRQLELGGLAGTRDPGMLASAVHAPQTGYYYSLAELASVLAFGLAKNHPFVDGNKRTALQAAAVFLRLNGHPLVLTKETEDLMVAVARGDASRELLWGHLVTLMAHDVAVDD